MTQLFAISLNGNEYSLVYVDETVGFAGKVNGVIVCTGLYTDVRNQIMECYEYNRDARERLN